MPIVPGDELSTTKLAIALPASMVADARRLNLPMHTGASRTDREDADAVSERRKFPRDETG